MEANAIIVFLGLCRTGIDVIKYLMGLGFRKQIVYPARVKNNDQEVWWYFRILNITNNHMSRISTKMRLVFLILFTAAVLIAGGIYAVYNGYILLNNPSSGQYPIKGVDISHYQGTVDWDVLSKQGICFAYIKATEGSSHVDENFAFNWGQSEKVPLRVGAYHFFSFDSPGKTQAENFIKNVGQREHMLVPTVDVEYYADKKNNPPDPELVRAELTIVLDELQKYYQVKPVIYSTEEFWEKYLKGYFEEYPLWIRNVLTKPNIEGEWTFWQYSNRGQMAGYSGEEKYIDLNVFNGDESAWEEWTDKGVMAKDGAAKNGWRRGEQR